MIGAGFVARGVANQIVRRNLPRDMALTYEDVKVPEDRLCDRLRREQDRHLLG